ncbi:MAG: hypothetical protein QXT28_08955 [Thermofilaceae archaeon]
MSMERITPTTAGVCPAPAGGIAGSAPAAASPAAAAGQGQGLINRRYVGKILLLEWEEEVGGATLLRVSIKRGYNCFGHFMQVADVAVRKDLAAQLLPKLEEIITDEDLANTEVYMRTVSAVNSVTVDYALRAVFEERGDEEELIEIEVRER